MRSAGTTAAAAARSSAAFGYVTLPGERDVVAALDGHVEEPGRREAVEDHGAREAGEGGCRVGIRVARVDHDRQARRRRELELALEELALDRPRREVVEVVEARLADRDGARVLEQLDELVDAGLASAPPA